ncbi:hypothetical protein TBLA_0I00140 [Henningerozyma blattae CBS 6284]|uniref:Peroxisomal membrane protein PEX11 n=1 Tax=Henningerozyma blattae (strain ATCC 34711 / CBS 6284 / DSM 70876 / NBRC 10599 / NRRL Y-10934 / UCD 77-7) TaxID=1071380 RepID=I2H8H7_HENB6|nr:hypothetical protein TBLA_0I00140 [Tetrapisispora blattae CBS 6284]CCH62679.1 hypothetical protein TBLA_0I00140 [Tetrapisispora blattae CBS 6284]
MVCDTIVYHPTITRLLKFLDTTVGREKVLRLLQYLCRFIAIRQHSSVAKQLQVQFVMMRKVLRFFKPLSHVQAASRAFDNKLASDNVLRIGSIIKDLSMAGYLTLDQINLLRIFKLVPVNNLTGKKIPRWTNWLWLFGLISGIVLDLRKANISNKKIEILEKEALLIKTSGEEGTKEKNEESIIQNKKLLVKSKLERKAAIRKLVWDALDSYIVLNNLQYLKSGDDRTGLAGMVTSVMAIQDLW